MIVHSPKRHTLFMKMALLVRDQGTCSRNKVGCVITDSRGTAVVGMGYNGNAAGAPNHCDRPNMPGNCGCIHAETNALLKAPYHIDSGLVMYTTTGPCERCAKLIVNSRVNAVVFLNAYRNIDGIRFLLDMDIEVLQMLERDNGLFDFIPVNDVMDVRVKVEDPT